MILRTYFGAKMASSIFVLCDYPYARLFLFHPLYLRLSQYAIVTLRLRLSIASGAL